jgi:hypothetical protein
MKKILPVFLFQFFVAMMAAGQSLTINDLLTLSSTPSKNISSFLGKKGFELANSIPDTSITIISFLQRKKRNRAADSVICSVNLYRENDCYLFILNTSSIKEYEDGCNWLKKNQFFYTQGKDSSRTAAYIFEKRNYLISTMQVITENDTAYRFSVRKKELPDAQEIQYAEDLLRFESHEYLASFFGEKNVIKDYYYFNEKDLKNCSVLFPNTNQQAIFIWTDEENYRNLSYILISGILPTMSAVQYTGSISQNKWVSKTGLYSGMRLADLVKANNGDIDFFGRKSDLSFLIDPASSGDINFKTCSVMLGCVGCGGFTNLLDKEKVGSQEAIAKNLQLYIFYLMIPR